MTQFEEKANHITDGKYEMLKAMQNLSALSVSGLKLQADFEDEGVRIGCNLNKNLESTSARVTMGLAAALVGTLMSNLETGSLDGEMTLGVIELLEMTIDTLRPVSENYEKLKGVEPKPEQVQVTGSDIEGLLKDLSIEQLDVLKGLLGL